MSPGVWKYEEIVVIPEARRALPGLKNFRPRTLKSQAIVYAPGDGANATAIYAATSFGIYHIDPKTRAITFAGKIPSYDYPEHPKHKGKLIRGEPYVYLNFTETVEASKDAIDGEARLYPTQRGFGDWLTADPVTGRVYFLQGTVPTDTGTLKKPYVVRYAEQLRPYTLNGKEVHVAVHVQPDTRFRRLRRQRPGLSPGQVRRHSQGLLRRRARRHQRPV